MKKLILLLFISFIGYGQENIERYKLYETSNMFTSLLLDTATGRIWQLQIGLKDVKQTKTILNDEELAISVSDAKDLFEIRKMIIRETGLKEGPLTFEDAIETDFYNVQKNGRFKLYPTDNDFNFIMLDVISGESYQVQWNNDKDYRFIERFSDYPYETD